MRSLLDGFDSPIQEWRVVGRKLVEMNPDATLYDLISCMYEYKTGCDMPDMPDEEEVVKLHMQGHAKSDIAEALDCETEEVDDVLTSIGFKAFRTPPETSPIRLRHAMMYDEQAEVKSELSQYTYKRCLREARKYGEYLDARRFE